MYKYNKSLCLLSVLKYIFKISLLEYIQREREREIEREQQAVAELCQTLIKFVAFSKLRFGIIDVPD